MEGGEPRFFAVTNNTVREVSAGKVGVRSFIVHNDDSAARFVQVFNAAAADVTLGTTVADTVWQVAADTTLVIPLEDAVFQTACSFAVTTTRNGSTGPTAADVTVIVR